MFINGVILNTMIFLKAYLILKINNSNIEKEGQTILY